LVGCANQDIALYRDSLERAFTESEMKEIQRQISARRLFFQWLNEAITIGNQAEQNLDLIEDD